MSHFDSTRCCAIYELAIAPSDTNILYCFTETAFYKSTNSGEEWFNPIDPSPLTFCEHLKINPYNENSLYVLNYMGLHKSTDGGITWINLLNTNDIVDFELHPTDTLKIFLIDNDYFGEDGETNFYKTINGGNTWEKMNNGLPESDLRIFLSICLNPAHPDEILVGLNFWGVYKSVNGGDSWERTNITHAEPSDLHVYPADQNVMLVTVDGIGLYQTLNKGADWIKLDLESQFLFPQYGQIGVHPNYENLTYVCDAGGVHKTSDCGTTWKYILLNTGIGDLQIGSVAIDPFDSAHVFLGSSSVFKGNIYETIDGGDNWDIIDIENTHSYRQILFDPNTPNVIYLSAGEAGILKSTDGFVTWEAKNAGLNKAPSGEYLPCHLAIRQDSTNILYAVQNTIGDDIGGVYKSIDGGDYWHKIDQNLVNKSALAISISPENPNTIYVAIEEEGVYKTTNDGMSWDRINDIMTSDISGNKLVISNDIGNFIYVNTEFGVGLVTDSLISTSKSHEILVQDKLMLFQNFPNPFNESTKIKYLIHTNLNLPVRLKIYDIQGREIKTLVDRIHKKGLFEITYSVNDLSSGLYFYRLESEKYSSTRKMLFLK